MGEGFKERGLGEGEIWKVGKTEGIGRMGKKG